MSSTVQHLTDSQQAPILSSRPPRPLRVVIAHDWLCGMRGGELVLDAIIRHGVSSGWEIRALFLMFDNEQPHTPAIDSLPKVVSPLGRIPFFSNRFRRELFPFYPMAVGSLSSRLSALHDQAPIDLVISTSSAAIKGLEMPRGSACKHLCYIHAPARYAWALQEQYSQGSLLRRIGLSLTTPAFRAWDLKTSANVHHFMANAHYTAAQVRRCYSREASVLHPPVRTDLFVPPSPSSQRESFWLAVSALEPYKRIDLAIAAANRLQHPLIIAGTGSQMPRLQAMAGPTVRFLGRIEDETLMDLYQRARMLIFPQIEDFGIVAVEAQACGLPVLAYKDGGALDTVIDDVTGAFFDSQEDPTSLIQAARRVPVGCDHACRENALRFSYEAFEKGLDAQITHVLTA